MRDKKKVGRVNGYIMAAVGVANIIITALNYIFGWKAGLPPAALGIVFLGVGMAWIRRLKRTEVDNAQDLHS